MTPLLEKLIELIARFLILVGVEPTEDNILILIVVVIAFLLIVLLLSWESDRYRNPKKRKQVSPGKVGPNPTNGLVFAPGDYPWVFRLTREDDLTGWLIKLQEGLQSYLTLEDEYYELRSIRQITKGEIDAIQEELDMEGMGTFSIQGERWEVVRRLSFRAKVLDGTPPYFPGKEGVFDYTFAANASQHGEDREMFLLENPHIPNKPTKLVTWALVVPTPISEEEFQAVAGEILAPFIKEAK
jgi:hypothetical protein